MNNFKKSLLMAEIVQIKRIDLSKNKWKNKTVQTIHLKGTAPCWAQLQRQAVLRVAGDQRSHKSIAKEAHQNTTHTKDTQVKQRHNVCWTKQPRTTQGHQEHKRMISFFLEPLGCWSGSERFVMKLCFVVLLKCGALSKRIQTVKKSSLLPRLAQSEHVVHKLESNWLRNSTVAILWQNKQKRKNTRLYIEHNDTFASKDWMSYLFWWK